MAAGKTHGLSTGGSPVSSTRNFTAGSGRPEGAVCPPRQPNTIVGDKHRVSRWMGLFPSWSPTWSAIFVEPAARDPPSTKTIDKDHRQRDSTKTFPSWSLTLVGHPCRAGRPGSYQTQRPSRRCPNWERELGARELIPKTSIAHFPWPSQPFFHERRRVTDELVRRRHLTRHRT